MKGSKCFTELYEINIFTTCKWWEVWFTLLCKWIALCFMVWGPSLKSRFLVQKWKGKI